MLTPTPPVMLQATNPSTSSSQNSIKDSDSGSSDTSFSQALSREVADRQNSDDNQTSQTAASRNSDGATKSTGNSASTDSANSANASDTSDTANAAASASSPTAQGKNQIATDKSSTGKDGKSDDDKDQDSPADIVAGQSPADMLALVTSLNPAAGQPGLITQAKVGASNPAANTAASNPVTAEGKALKLGTPQSDAQLLKPAIQANSDTSTNTASNQPFTSQLADQLNSTDASALGTGPANGSSAASITRLADASAITATSPGDALAAKLASTDALTAAINPAALQLTPLANLAAQTMASGLNDKLSPRVGSPDWNQALGQKIVWMVGDHQQSASLTLNPPDLGPMQVVLNVSNNQAHASFTAAQPEVRQALEAALPQLRQMMSDAGIQLGQASVSANSQQQSFFTPQQGGSKGQGQSGRTDSNSADDSSIVPLAQNTSLRSGRGLVDTFA